MSDLKQEADIGRGRAYVLLYSQNKYTALITPIAELLSKRARVLVLRLATVHDSNWQALYQSFSEYLESQKIRQASFVGFGEASILIQNLCLLNVKKVRSVAYIDSITRSHPTRLNQFVDKMERRLPLGLPLRLRSKAFDGKPFLQRMRSPALVVSTALASDYELSEADILCRGLPTSWRIDLSEQKAEEMLVEELFAFQDVPAKCPQKAKTRRAPESGERVAQSLS